MDADSPMKAVFTSLGTVLTQAQVLGKKYFGDFAMVSLHAQLLEVKSNLQLAQLYRDKCKDTEENRESEHQLMQTVFTDLDKLLTQTRVLGEKYRGDLATETLHALMLGVKYDLQQAQLCRDGRKSDDKLLVQAVFKGLHKLLELAPVLGEKYRGDPATETLHDQLSQVKKNLVKAQQHGDGRKSEDKLMQTVFDELDILLTQAEVLVANYRGDPATETLHAQLDKVKSNLELAQLCRNARTGTKKTRKREDEHEDGAPAHKKAKNFGADISAEVMRKSEEEHDRICMEVTGQKLVMKTDHDNVKGAMEDMA